MLVISSWKTRRLRARGLSTVIASTGTIWISVAVVIRQPQLCSRADLAKPVQRVEAVGIKKDRIALRDAEPRRLDVDMRQKVIIQWLFIARRQAHGDRDIGPQSRIEPQVPAHRAAVAGAQAAGDDDRAGEFAVDRDQALRAVARDGAAQLFDLGDDVPIHVGMHATQYAVDLDRSVGALLHIADKPIDASKAAEPLTVGQADRQILG